MKILVADDHDLVRETIAAFLQREGMSKVITAANLDEAIAAVDLNGSFDLVLLDYNMPGMNGLAGLERMIKANAGRPVAILSGTASLAIAEQSIKAGAVGFVPKTLGSHLMVNAARSMASGEIFAPFELLQPEGTDHYPSLSARELEVLSGLCQGLSNKEMATDLGVQEVTIKLHVKTLSRKLGARNRTHAAMIAIERKLI